MPSWELPGPLELFLWQPSQGRWGRVGEGPGEGEVEGGQGELQGGFCVTPDVQGHKGHDT